MSEIAERLYKNAEYSFKWPDLESISKRHLQENLISVKVNVIQNNFFKKFENLLLLLG